MLEVPPLALQQKAGLGELESKGTAPDTGQGDDTPPLGAGMNQHEGQVISGEARGPLRSTSQHA